MKNVMVFKKVRKFCVSVGSLDRDKLFMMLALGLIVVCWAQTSMAMTTPAAGSFAYDIYDIVVNSILKGAVGFVAGIGFIVLGAFLIAKTMVYPSIACIIAGVILIKADTIVGSMGALIC